MSVSGKTNGDERSDYYRMHITGFKVRGLKIIVLDLLGESPLRGSEIMSLMEQRTMGRWRPSPGSIYPLLSDLELKGLAVRRKDGRYDLTDLGRQEIVYYKDLIRNFSRPSTTSEMISEIESYLSFFEDVLESLEPYKADLVRIRERIEKIIKKLNGKRRSTD
ncbi:MAG: PadR family transcriptional regulator [Candidatus Thermoplasmatota archaeon]|nr:PadR family transcriptional regulator [Candidatus Thermoplasmatota archaeon]MCL5731123.1 PadR family transcriptional regulator [Candidatus Thermoplasmatota archaeon]